MHSLLSVEAGGGRIFGDNKQQPEKEEETGEGGDKNEEGQHATTKGGLGEDTKKNGGEEGNKKKVSSLSSVRVQWVKERLEARAEMLRLEQPDDLQRHNKQVKKHLQNLHLSMTTYDPPLPRVPPLGKCISSPCLFSAGTWTEGHSAGEGNSPLTARFQF